MKLMRLRNIILAAFVLSFISPDSQTKVHRGGAGFFHLVDEADARLAFRRPARPVSAAGVARRTTRRVIRRGAYVAAVPAGCPYGVYNGYRLYYCGGTYYQASGSGYAIVYF